MATYAQWNEAIFHYCFPITEEDSPVYLSVDDDVLSEIALTFELECECASASEDFLTAVRDTVVLDSAVETAPINQCNEGIGLPPHVAFLALLVLAAARRAVSEIGDLRVRSTNYYVRLNQLLGLEGARKPSGLNNLEVERLWFSLREFLQKNQRGVLQLSKGPVTRRFIWYAISQSLLSRHDRGKLREFFQLYKLPFFCSTDTKLPEFDDLFLAWAARSNLSRRLKRVLSAEPQRREAILEQVRVELSRWDGRTEEESSSEIRSRRGSLRLRADRSQFNEIYFSLIGSRQSNDPLRLHLEENPLEVEFLDSVSEQSEFYDPIPLADFASLESPIVLESQERNAPNFRWKPAEVLVLQRNSMLFGAFAEVRRPVMGEESIIICRSGYFQKVRSSLLEISQLTELEIDQCCTEIFDNWTLFESVILERTLETSDPKLSCLVVDRARRIALKGGVKLPSPDRVSTYMIGYPPTVCFTGEWSTEDSISLNGERITLTSRIELPELSSGVYTIASSTGQTTTFRLTEPLRYQGGYRFRGLERLGGYYVETEDSVDNSFDLGISIVGGYLRQSERIDSPKRALTPQNSRIPISSDMTDQTHRNLKQEYAAWIAQQTAEAFERTQKVEGRIV